MQLEIVILGVKGRSTEKIPLPFLSRSLGLAFFPKLRCREIEAVASMFDNVFGFARVFLRPNRRSWTLPLASRNVLNAGESYETTARYRSTGAIVFQPPPLEFRQPAWTQKPTMRLHTINCVAMDRE
jgi:hypothetical protein